MSVPMAPSAQPAIEQLRATVRGRVVTPTDPEYDAWRVVMIGGVDPRPAVIVRVADAGDVAAAVAVASTTGLEIAVRAGGHSGAGHSTVDGGLVIDLRDLTTLEIDPEARTAWADAGLTAFEVTSGAAKHGLGIGFGDTGSVGISGITLGGGIGYLVRKHGLTIDNLLAAEIVTADGSLLQVDATTHPDLFWALRGGGGNFGVVTRLKYRLQPLGSIVGGIMVLPATAETVAGFIAAAEAAPEELSTIAN
ncbi:MAG TPA: FAD-binding oxidoreductase, partial [Candidatus Limnocylindrales bacterium]|nr:FAD-binding oxidoreductase [Candidatus Limnocylindrales bacterium]